MPAYQFLNIHDVGTLTKAYCARPVAKHYHRFLAALEEYYGLPVLGTLES